MTTTTRAVYPPILTAGLLGHAARRLAPGDIRARTEQRSAALAFTACGDPPADAVIAMAARMPPGHARALIDTAIEHGITAVPDPPPELREFFTAIAMPYWVDPGQLDHAARVTARTGAAGLSALVLGLLGGYLAFRVTKTLTATGDLEHAAPRRLAETARWFAEVTAPGGLEPDAPGYQNILRVRLTHARVRAALTARPDWDFHTWHHPINQSQLCGTTMLFAWSLIHGARALGLRFTTEETAAIYHQWRYIGYLSGVDTRILPTCERDYWRLCWLQADLEFGAPDHDSRTLAHALITATATLTIGDRDTRAHRAARWAVTETLSAYARLVLGPRASQALGLSDNTAMQAAVAVAAVSIRALEHTRTLLPGATRRCESWGARCQRALITRMNTTRHQHQYRSQRAR